MRSFITKKEEFEIDGKKYVMQEMSLEQLLDMQEILKKEKDEIEEKKVIELSTKCIFQEGKQVEKNWFVSLPASIVSGITEIFMEVNKDFLLSQATKNQESKDK